MLSEIIYFLCAKYVEGVFMIYVEFYGENQDGFPSSMIKRKFITDNPCEQVASLAMMTKEELDIYESIHKEEWEAWILSQPIGTNE